MDRPVLSVTELNERVKGLLELDPMLADVCVRGELSNYKIYPSGHHYFTLKDQESSLKCVMFRSSAARLRFRPENGMRVFASGSLRVYPRDGAYQVNAVQMRIAEALLNEMCDSANSDPTFLAKSLPVLPF